jgi:hypothetical protein
VCTGTADEITRVFQENDWTDGFPIVPPTIERVEALEDTTPLQAAVSDTTRFVQVRDDARVNPARVAYVMADGSGTYVKVVNGGAPTPWAIGDVLRALGVEG